MNTPSHPPFASIPYKSSDRANEAWLEPMLYDIGYEGKRLIFAARGFALDYLRNHTGCTMRMWAEAVESYCKGYVDALCHNEVLEHFPGLARVWGGG